MRHAIMAMVFAALLTACGAGGFTRVDKPDYPLKQYSTTAHGRAETDVRAGLVVLTIDRFDPFTVMNFDITITGYDKSGIIVFRERTSGQIAYPIYSRPITYFAPAGLTALRITNFETEGR